MRKAVVIESELRVYRSPILKSLNQEVVRCSVSESCC
jgi:hypothetical protein